MSRMISSMNHRRGVSRMISRMNHRRGMSRMISSMNHRRGMSRMISRMNHRRGVSSANPFTFHRCFGARTHACINTRAYTEAHARRYTHACINTHVNRKTPISR
jgi:hypothetical protein